jgi:hypothetical protein
MVVVDSGDCNVPLLFRGTTAVLVCLLHGFLSNYQPRCISFALVQDEVHALVWDKIFALVQDEISFCCERMVHSIFLSQSVISEFLLTWACFWWGKRGVTLWVSPILLKRMGVSGTLVGK